MKSCIKCGKSFDEEAYSLHTELNSCIDSTIVNEIAVSRTYEKEKDYLKNYLKKIKNKTSLIPSLHFTYIPSASEIACTGSF